MKQLALLFALSCVCATACIQDDEPSEASISISDGADGEPTGAAQAPMTSDQCWAQYKAGETVCQGMPPNAAMGCFLAIRAILAVCIASAS